MSGPIFIALDFDSAAKAQQFLTPFEQLAQKPAVKVGMELFYAAGPSLVQALRQAGFTVFLDLKLYDIPHTVGQAVVVLRKLDVQYLTVHAAGGAAMLAQAQAAAGEQLKLLAVTQLTSFSEAEVQDIHLSTASLDDTVVHLAQLADQAGLAGTISSPHEARLIGDNTRPGFLKITPGIRLAGDAVGDQKRVTTPADARRLGSDGIVVGRSITQAANPVAAYQEVEGAWQAND
ncbi:orotidine-5'-phosphate decarboxylase [Lactobacillaceae bacterium L1_55_11]|nr:orotidine-5'-phosphate decarboxylase [Lactobacillaceae bacterium L1_55_11]